MNAREKRLADALRELVRVTYHMADTSAATGDAFPNAHKAARDVLRLADTDLLVSLATPNEAARHPLLAALAFCEARQDDEFFRRLAGSLRKAHALEVVAGRA
jgi:hypothetical protein